MLVLMARLKQVLFGTTCEGTERATVIESCDKAISLLLPDWTGSDATYPILYTREQRGALSRSLTPTYQPVAKWDTSSSWCLGWALKWSVASLRSPTGKASFGQKPRACTRVVGFGWTIRSHDDLTRKGWGIRHRQHCELLADASLSRADGDRE